MSTRIHLCTLIILVGCFWGCNKSSGPSDPHNPVRDLTSTEKQILSVDNSFGISLFTSLNRNQTGANVIISPLSVSMAFGMVLNGADGPTKTAIHNTLGYQGYTDQEINQAYRNIIDNFTQIDPKVQLELANSIWYRKGLQVESTFVDVNSRYFDADVQALDFSSPLATAAINNWVNQKTHGLIDKILDNDIPPQMIMYLINALYYKGTWTTMFDSTKTINGYFTTDGGAQQPCRLMPTGGELRCYEDQSVQAVGLPYGNGAFEMIVVLPKDEHAIASYVASLTQSSWEQLVSNLAQRDGTLLLPRFKLTYKEKLNDVLKIMGMSVAFSQDSADFTRICRFAGGRIYIDEVLHKTYIEVNEEGTEAAAVTSIGMGVTSTGPDDSKFSMVVDHPFVFCIREVSSGSLVFIGKVVTLFD
jgi:serine protease inhibitor